MAIINPSSFPAAGTASTMTATNGIKVGNGTNKTINVTHTQTVSDVTYEDSFNLEPGQVHIWAPLRAGAATTFLNHLHTTAGYEDRGMVEINIVT